MSASIIAGWFMRKQLIPTDVLSGVARFVGFAALAYLYLKLWSWAATNYYAHVPEQQLGLELLAENTPYNFTFWFGEVLFGALVPAIFLLWRRTRTNSSVIVLAGFMLIAGLVINRWNVTLSGFVLPLDWSPGVANVFPLNTYEPALVEWLVALGIVAYSWLVFTLGVRFLKLYPNARDLTVLANPRDSGTAGEEPPATIPPQP
jgi:Ni/Fe-hydrogenase subunit HybB-like protein